MFMVPQKSNKHELKVEIPDRISQSTAKKLIFL